METRIVEVTNRLNYGRFMLARFDAADRARPAMMDGMEGLTLIKSLGWGRDALWVLDLATGEGAIFHPCAGTRAAYDLEKHRVWVCPLFEPFLEWLYQQADPWAIPDVMELPGTEHTFAFAGHRRSGPSVADTERPAIRARLFEHMFGDRSIEASSDGDTWHHTSPDMTRALDGIIDAVLGVQP